MNFDLKDAVEHLSVSARRKVKTFCDAAIELLGGGSETENARSKLKEITRQTSDQRRNSRAARTFSMEDFEMALKKRSDLENDILRLVSAKTGMYTCWTQLENAASEENVVDFQQCAAFYHDKAESLRHRYDALCKLISAGYTRRLAKQFAKYPEAKMLTEPYKYTEECEKLLKDDKSLVRVLEDHDLTEEKLADWYRQRFEPAEAPQEAAAEDDKEQIGPVRDSKNASECSGGSVPEAMEALP